MKLLKFKQALRNFKIAVNQLTSRLKAIQKVKNDRINLTNQPNI